MKLLIIVNWYPPDQRVPARRWGGLVSELQKIGVDCTVLSAGDGAFWTGVGDAGERIIRLPISNRAPKRVHNARSLRERIRIIIKNTIRFFIPLFFRGRNIKIWRDALISHPEVTQAAQECEVVVASYGPIAPLLLGRYIASIYNKPSIIDIRDSFQAKEGVAFFLSRKVSRFIERRLLSQANARITIGKRLASYMTNQYGLAFHAIYNGWSDEDAQMQLQDNCEGADEDESPYLYYAGTIYQHRLDALMLVLKALRNVELKLRVRVLSDNTKQGLQTVVEEHGMADRVDLLPPVSSTAVAEEMSRSCGLLVFENVNSSELHDGTVTGKLFGLLASGMPGIAVCSPSSEIQEIVAGVEGWSAVSTEADCRHAISALLTDKKGYVGNGKGITDYSVSAQAKKFYALLKSLAENGNRIGAIKVRGWSV